MSETPTMPGPNKLCPILMIVPPKTGTYVDIVCLEDKCQMWRAYEFLVKEAIWELENVYSLYEGFIDRRNQISAPVYETRGYCGLAGKP